MVFSHKIDIERVEILKLRFREGTEKEKYEHGKEMINYLRKKLELKEKETNLFMSTLQKDQTVMYELYFK